MAKWLSRIARHLNSFLFPNQLQTLVKMHSMAAQLSLLLVRQIANLKDGTIIGTITEAELYGMRN